MERMHEELYKGDLNELDYHHDVVSHLEPDMLERSQVGLRKHRC